MTTPTTGTITVTARARISRRGSQVAEEIARARIDRTLRRANLAVAEGAHVIYSQGIEMGDAWSDEGLNWAAVKGSYVEARVEAEPPPRDTATLHGPDGPLREVATPPHVYPGPPPAGLHHDGRGLA